MQQVEQETRAGLCPLSERNGGLSADHTGFRLTLAETADIGHCGARGADRIRSPDYRRRVLRPIIATRQQDKHDA